MSISINLRIRLLMFPISKINHTIKTVLQAILSLIAKVCLLTISIKISKPTISSWNIVKTTPMLQECSIGEIHVWLRISPSLSKDFNIICLNQRPAWLIMIWTKMWRQWCKINSLRREYWRIKRSLKIRLNHRIKV